MATTEFKIPSAEYVDSIKMAQDGLKVDIDAKQNKSISLSGITAKSVTGALTELNTKATANTSAVSSIQGVQTQMQNSIETLTGRVDTANSTIGGHTTSIDNIKRDVGAIQSLNQTQDTKISKLTTDLGTATSTANSAKTSADNALKKANEALSLSQQRSQSKVYETKSALITALKGAKKSDFAIGDTLFVKEKNVPDYWVSAILENNSGATGYFEITELESDKIDLSAYQLKNVNVEGIGATTVENALLKIKQETTANANYHKTLDTKVASNLTEITATKKRVDTLEAFKSSATTDIANLKSADTTISGKVDTANSEIAKLKAKDTALENKINANTDKLATIKVRDIKREGDFYIITVE